MPAAENEPKKTRRVFDDHSKQWIEVEPIIGNAITLHGAIAEEERIRKGEPLPERKPVKTVRVFNDVTQEWIEVETIDHSQLGEEEFNLTGNHVHMGDSLNETLRIREEKRAEEQPK